MEKIIWSNYVDPLVLSMLYNSVYNSCGGKIDKVAEIHKFLQIENSLRLEKVRKKLSVMVDNLIVERKLAIKNDIVFENVSVLNSYMLSDCFKSELPVVKWYVHNENLKSIEQIEGGAIYTTYRVLGKGITFDALLDKLDCSKDRNKSFLAYSNPLGKIVDNILLNSKGVGHD
jgi:hypothetical protein